MHRGWVCGWPVTRKIPSQHLGSIPSAGLYLRASFSPCSVRSPVSLLVGGPAGWQVGGDIQPGAGRRKPNKGMKYLRAPGFTWAPDELGPGVWLCNKEKNVLSPDTGPHWQKPQACLRRPGMC